MFKKRAKTEVVEPQPDPAVKEVAELKAYLEQTGQVVDFLVWRNRMLLRATGYVKPQG